MSLCYSFQSRESLNGTSKMMMSLPWNSISLIRYIQSTCEIELHTDINCLSSILLLTSLIIIPSWVSGEMGRVKSLDHHHETSNFWFLFLSFSMTCLVSSFVHKSLDHDVLISSVIVIPFVGSVYDVRAFDTSTWKLHGKNSSLTTLACLLGITFSFTCLSPCRYYSLDHSRVIRSKQQVLKWNSWVFIFYFYLYWSLLLHLNLWFNVFGEHSSKKLERLKLENNKH